MINDASFMILTVWKPQLVIRQILLPRLPGTSFNNVAFLLEILLIRKTISNFWYENFRFFDFYFMWSHIRDTTSSIPQLYPNIVAVLCIYNFPFWLLEK